MASTDYVLPALPMGSPDITILRWLKPRAERIQAGEPLLIVLNDRVELALPAPYAAVIEQVLTPEGGTAVVGASIAVLAPAELAAREPTTPAELATPEPSAPAEPLAPAVPRATPLARRIAAAAGVDLSRLPGSGPSGRVTKADVLAAMAPASVSVPAASVLAIPDLAAQPPVDTYVLTAMEADLSQAAAVCARLAPEFARRGLALDAHICVMQAVAAALLSHPQLNSWFDDEQIIVPRRVHLGYRWPSRVGVVADAQDRNLRGMARALAGSSDAPATTFTIAASEAPAWLPQQLPGAHHTAALAVGAARPRPVVRGTGAAAQIVVRPIALLSLMYDARVVDQARADAFLRDVVERVEHYRG